MESHETLALVAYLRPCQYIRAYSTVEFAGRVSVEYEDGAFCKFVSVFEFVLEGSTHTPLLRIQSTVFPITFTSPKRLDCVLCAKSRPPVVSVKGGATVNVKLSEFDAPSSSLAVTLNVIADADAVGVPINKPVVVLNVSQLGRVPVNV